MTKFQKTGDPEVDALFKAANKRAKAPVAEKPLEIVAVSDEPIKPEGNIQNSGIKLKDKEVLVPIMSQEELENNTPSRGKAMTPIKVPEGLSATTFMLLLSNAYALYVTEGAYDNDSLQRRTGLAPGTISKCIATPEFKRALSLRGVTPNSTGLTREQDLVLLTLTDPSDGKNLQQKLRACGVSFATYRGWMKQPVFRAQMEAFTEGALSDNSHALVQLDKLAGQGDLAAIKFKMELNGRYDPNKQQNIDVIAMMSMMMDIISRNVRDQDQLANISQEFGALASTLRLKQIGA